MNRTPPLKISPDKTELLTSAVGLWKWDVAAGVLQGDRRFAELYGLNRAAAAEGVATNAFFAAIHLSDRLRIRMEVAGVLHGADVFDKEYRLSQSDDGPRWVSARGRAERDEFGRVLRFHGVLTDITDQKRVQERLRVAQAAGGVGTFEYVSGFGTVDVSEEFCRLLGLTPTDAVALRAINAVLPQGSPSLIAIDDAEGEQPTREFKISRANDSGTRWIARKGEVRRDGPDGGLRFIGVIHDITEFKTVENKLRDLTATLEDRVEERTRERDRVWNNSRDLLAVIDKAGTIVEASPSWQRVLGYSTEDLIGQARVDRVVEEDVAKSEQAFQRAIAGEDINNLETRYRHKDGSIRWISWRTSLDDNLVYAYGRDITDDKERAEILQRTEGQLRQAQKMEAVGQLTGGLAHDFNNMLTGVIGGLDVVRRRIAEGRFNDVGRFMDSATTSAQRAAKLTHRLLAFSRQQSLDPQPVDAGSLVESMEDMLGRTLGEQVRLKVLTAPGLWLALADANQLESAILNLAINARDAMPGGGALLIEADNVVLGTAYADAQADATAGEHVVICVTDSGSGMPEEVAAKAFDPFFTTKPIGQGTGLGLSMIYGFARQTGGHATLSSELGVGTTVKIFLPRFTGVAEVEAFAGPFAPTRATGEGQTVLVVEDEISVRQLIVEALGDLGYNALEAENGDDAIAQLRLDIPIDLLVSDVGLPGLNGREVADIARQLRPGLRVLFVTGYAPGATVRGAFLAPGMDMIAKPFAMNELAAKISEMLAGS